MTKLLRAELAALIRNKFFYVTLAISAAFGIFIGVLNIQDYYVGGYAHTMFDGIILLTLGLYFVLAAFIAWTVGTQHSDGVLRNKLIVGHRRELVYLTELVVMLVAAICMIAVFTALQLAIAVPTFGKAFFDKASGEGLLVMCSVTLSMCAISTLIAMLCRSRAASSIVCLGLAIVMLLVAMFAITKLQEPEFFKTLPQTEDGYSETITSGVNVFTDGEYVLEPNPDYPRGVWRNILTVIADLMPAGPWLYAGFGDLTGVWRHLAYAGGLFVVTTAVGLFVFRRENLK